MAQPVEQLEAEAMKLSLEDRAYLAGRLLASLRDPDRLGSVDEDDPEYRAMLRRRIDEVDSGVVKPLPGEKVFTDLLEKHGR